MDSTWTWHVSLAIRNVSRLLPVLFIAFYILLNIFLSRVFAWKVGDMRSENDGCEMHSAFDVPGTSFMPF